MRAPIFPSSWRPAWATDIGRSILQFRPPKVLHRPRYHSTCYTLARARRVQLAADSIGGHDKDLRVAADHPWAVGEIYRERIVWNPQGTGPAGREKRVRDCAARRA